MNSKLIKIILAVLVLVIAGYVFWAYKKPSQTSLQTFKSEKCGFAIQYPASLKINIVKEGCPDDVFFGMIYKPADEKQEKIGPGSDLYVSINVQPLKRIREYFDYQTLDKYLELIKTNREKDAQDSAAGVFFILSQSTLDGNDAFLFEANESSAVANKEVSYYAERNGYLYILSYAYPEGYVQGEYSEKAQVERYDMIKKVVSTFKFTN